MNLLDHVLGCLPCLTRHRRRALIRKVCICARAQLRHGALHEAALSEACAQEGRVDEEQDPGSSLKQQRRAQKPEPEKDLENGDEGHAGIVVLFDELANVFSESGFVWFLTRRGRRCGGGLQDREEVRTSVGCDVKDGVDGKR